MLFEAAEQKLDEKEKDTGTELLLRVFRHFYLEEIDRQWVDHLTDMEHLRDGIGLRGYGQRDPKQEYKKEGYDVFMTMMAATSSNVCSKLFKVQVKREKEIERIEREDAEKHAAQLRAMQMRHGSEPATEEEGPAPARVGAPAAPARPVGSARAPRRPEDRAQRPLPVRQRSKIQEVPRRRPRRRRRRRRESVAPLRLATPIERGGTGRAEGRKVSGRIRDTFRSSDLPVGPLLPWRVASGGALGTGLWGRSWW